MCIYKKKVNNPFKELNLLLSFTENVAYHYSLMLDLGIQYIDLNKIFVLDPGIHKKKF